MEKVIPINNKKPQPQPTIQKANFTPLEVAVLDWGKCGVCGNETFMEALKCKIVSAMHPKNSLGKPAKIWSKVLVCVVCKREIDKKEKEDE